MFKKNKMNAPDWINLITAVATFGLTILTAGYLMETRRLRILNEKIIERDNSELNLNIIGSKYFEKNKFFAFGVEVSNMGFRKASLIRIEGDGVRSLKRENIKDIKYSIENGGPTASATLIPYLLPKQKGYFYCEIDALDIKTPKDFQISITYRDSYNEMMINTYQVKTAINRNDYQTSQLFISKVLCYKKPVGK